MKKSRTLWHIFLLLLYPAAEEVAASDDGAVSTTTGPPTESMEVAFGEAFSVKCKVENGTVPVWSFNGGKELPEDAIANESEIGDDEEGAVSSRLDVPAANLNNVGEYRDDQFRWHFHKRKDEWAFAKMSPRQSGSLRLFKQAYSYLHAIDCFWPNEGAPWETLSGRRASSLYWRILQKWPIFRKMR